MEKTDIVSTGDLFQIAGKSFADYLGYPSFQEYCRRVSFFYADLTDNRILETHLAEAFHEVESADSYDEFCEELLKKLNPEEKRGRMMTLFRRSELISELRGGESFLSADGDCKIDGEQRRVLISCELSEQEGKERALFLLNDISDLYDPHSLARKYAEYDPLTKLFSRHAADAYAKEYFNLHPDDHAALVMIEVDRFKDFNDRYGHHVGDVVLKGIAREIEEHFGDAVIGRNAGQEFLVLLKNRRENEAEETVRSFSEKEHSLTYEGETYTYGFSIGYCLYPEQGILYHDLARKADKAKYNVRLGGGGSYCRFEDEMLNLNNY